MVNEDVILFRFKGTRDYVHGTDAFNAIIALFQDCQIDSIRFSVHDFMRVPKCHIYVAHSDEEATSVKHAEVECLLNVDGEKRFVLIKAAPELEQDIQRYAYDEDAIVDACCMVEDGIKLRQESPYSFIETVVAMNKHMHQQLFAGAEGKWVFTRLELDSYADLRNNLTLILRHNLNMRLTKTEILFDGRRIGHIYFSLVKS